MRLQTNLPGMTRPVPKAGIVVYLGWAALLGVIEYLGREAPNDLADSFLLSTLALGMLFGWLFDPWHIFTRLTTRGVACARRLFSGARIVFGIDFQDSAILPTAFPVWWQRAVIGSATLTGTVLMASLFWSGNLRGWLIGGSYLVYLLALGGLWTGLIAALVINAFLAFAVVHDFCVESYSGQVRRPLHGEIAGLAGSALVAVLGTILLGPGIPMAAILSGVAAWALSFPFCPIGFSVQWAQSPREPLQRFDGRWLWCQFGLLFLGTMTLISLACADRLWQSGPFPQDSTMPVTFALGSLLAWVSLATVTALLAHRLRTVWLTYQMASVRTLSARLSVQGRLRSAERAGLRAVLRRWGWSVRFGASRAGECDAGLVITPEQLRTWRAHGSWHLDAELLQSVCNTEEIQAGKRRSEIRCRRQLLRGLERLFKRRSRSSLLGGSGYWLGLQHAFILGLARDGSGNVDWDRETTILDEIIGMPFYAVIPPEARHHYRKVVKALQIDLIFVEDCVTFQRLVRVLRTMFEIYDMHAGRMPAREHQFSGLPGVRVILHEFEMQQAHSHGRTNYPEPDYEEIGHARILHVFRDRGEATQREEVPGATDWTPVSGGA